MDKSFLLSMALSGFVFAGCNDGSQKLPEAESSTLHVADSKEVIATIYPNQSYSRQISHFFLDLKGWQNLASTPEKAHVYFVDQDMNGVRVNIHGEPNKPAHPASGVVDGSYYEVMITSIKNAQEARGDKPFEIFASKKLQGKESFPDWVKDSNGVIPEKYVELLVDYFKYMNAQGLEIDYLGIDNEINFNEGNITPVKFNQIVNLFRQACIDNDIKMPKIIGPDRYEPMGDVDNCWIEEFMTAGYGDNLDIYGTHYYPNHRYLDKLTYELGLIEDKPFWATEPHWDKAEKRGGLMIAAEEAICALWDQTDNGMEGFMWWAYGTSPVERQYMCEEVSVPIYKAQPIRMDDLDGPDIQTYGKLQSRSFRRGNTLEVYFVNNTATTYKDVAAAVDAKTIDGLITMTVFTESTAAQGGETSTIEPVSTQIFSFTLPPYSMTHFTISLASD